MFVDTGGWYAHLVLDDVNHPVGRTLIDRAVNEGWMLFTTDGVGFETYALLVNPVPPRRG